MLGDLPSISSFTYAEAAHYKTEPQTPYQLFLRREPEPHERSAAARAKDADWRMRRCKEEERAALLGVFKASPLSGVEEASFSEHPSSAQHASTWAADGQVCQAAVCPRYPRCHGVVECLAGDVLFKHFIGTDPHRGNFWEVLLADAAHQDLERRLVRATGKQKQTDQKLHLDIHLYDVPINGNPLWEAEAHLQCQPLLTHQT